MICHLCGYIMKALLGLDLGKDCGHGLKKRSVISWLLATENNLTLLQLTTQLNLLAKRFLWPKY